MQVQSGAAFVHLQYHLTEERCERKDPERQPFAQRFDGLAAGSAVDELPGVADAREHALKMQMTRPARNVRRVHLLLYTSESRADRLC